LREHDATRETVAEYCTRQRIGLDSFYKWKRQLAAAGPAGLERLARGQGAAAAKSRESRAYTSEQRTSAVEAVHGGGLAVSSAARLLSLPQRTLSSWLSRFRKGGAAQLEPQPPGRRKGNVRKLSADVHAAIERVLREHPDFGLRKVRDYLGRFCGVSVTTKVVARVRKELELPSPAGRKRRPRPRSQEVRRFERARPMQLWQSDITSYWLGRLQQRVHLVVFLDDHSRYIVSHGLYLHMKQEIVLETFLAGIARFGRPEEVLTDQGRQYATWRGKSQFSRLLEREGVRHVLSQTHHPQTLGKCERLWDTIWTELWERVQPKDLVDARLRLDHYIAHYNHFRTHQGIEGLLPADRFFGATNALREVLEKRMERDELTAALSEAPRQRVYLFGQVGDQQISLHGEGGQIVIQTPQGGRKVIALEDLGSSTGVAESDKGKRDESAAERTGGEFRSSESCAGDGPAAESADSGVGHPERRTAAASDASLQEALALQEPAEASDRGEGAVDAGVGGGPGARAPTECGSAVDVAGAQVEERRGGGAGSAWAAGLAIEPDGLVRHARGPAEAAEVAEQGATRDGVEQRSRQGASRTAPGERDAEAAIGGRGAAGVDPVAVAQGTETGGGREAADRAVAGSRAERVGTGEESGACGETGSEASRRAARSRE
jgi:transposase InsO family protein